MKKGVVGLLGTVVGALGGAAAVYCLKENKTTDMKGYDKFKSYYNMLNQWLSLKQQGKSLEEYFIENNISKIAIYGMGEMGSRLYDELKNSSIEVVCGIDAKLENVFAEIEMVPVGKKIEGIDAVVVSAVFAFEEIGEKLSEYIDCEIISLEDIVFDMA